MRSMTQAQRRERERRQRQQQANVLRVLKQLWEAGGEIDLNQIDGEFYFRCCVPNCNERLAEALAIDSKNARAQIHAAEDLFADFQVPLDFARHFVFSGGALLGLRADDLTVVCDEQRRPEHVRLHIHSGAATGVNVAAAVDRVRLSRGLHTSEDHAFHQSVAITFDLVDGDSESDEIRRAQAEGRVYWRQYGHIVEQAAQLGPPYVEMTVGLPLPSHQVIATTYDLVVRQERKWNCCLAQASEQDAVVALRTWSVALLMKAGHTYGQALGQWQMQTGMKGNIRKTKFQIDRARLLSRVPEATRYLLIRQRPRLTA